jgi:hypothetical protein
VALWWMSCDVIHAPSSSSVVCILEGGTGGERCARWEVSGQQVGKSRKTQRRQVLGQTIGCHTCQVEQLADLFTEGNVAMGGEG